MTSPAQLAAVPRTAPFGTWPSPVSADEVANADSAPNWPGFVGGEAWWTERLPRENGRTTLMRRAADDGAAASVLPPPWSVRSRALEYGGRAWAAVTGGNGPLVVFVNASDQRLYRFEPESGEAPSALTAVSTDGDEYAYADLVLCADVAERSRSAAQVVWCMREHTRPGVPTKRSIAAVPLDGSAVADPARVRSVAEGTDFVTGPRLSADGRHMAWIGWDHPAMPWDRSGVYIARVEPDGTLCGVRAVAGPAERSIAQVQWTDDGSLYVVSDESGWWNIHRVDLEDGQCHPVCPREEEFGGPLSKLGLTWCKSLPGGRLAVIHGTDRTRLSVLDTASGELSTIASPHTDWAPLLDSDGERVLAVAASPTADYAAVLVDVATGRWQQVSTDRVRVDPEFLPEPRSRTFASEGGEPVHAVQFPPRNPDYTGPPGQLPPYVVLAHSGPTARVPAVYDLEIAYFTSRGIGVVAVNYRGSTGFGRWYRERLRGAWGVADVADCATVARALVEEGSADGSRLAIRGKSAGGWTAASSITDSSVYRCAALYYPLLDPVLWRESQTDGFEAHYPDALIGPWPESRRIYEARSPAERAQGGTAAEFVLFQGENDPICPPGQAERFIAAAPPGAVRAHRVFADERHGLKRAESIAESMETELAMYVAAFSAETEFVDEMVRAAAHRAPDRTAVEDAEGAWTYQELMERADAIASELADAGVGPGERVGILLGRTRFLTAALLAILQLGSAYVPLDPEYPAERLRFMTHDAGLRAILIDGDGQGAMPPAGTHTVVCVRKAATATVTAGRLRSRRSPEDAACLIYTSGSTGTPKGAVLAHRGICNILRHSRSYFGFTPADAVLALASFSFDFAQLELLLPLSCGGRVRIAERAVALDADLLEPELTYSGATFLMGTPSMFGALAALGWRPTSNLKIVSGGEALTPSIAGSLRPAGAVWNIYGPTETSIYSLSEPVTGPEITIGRPVSGTVVELLVGARRCAEGEVGELHIGGAGLATGYHARPDLTAQRFVQDPFRPGQRLYRTGDLARRRADGRYVYEGRIDDQVKIRGHRVEPGEIEEQLRRHPDVRSAAVVVERTRHAARLNAIVTLEPPAATTTDELAAYLAERLPPYARPSRVVIVEEIPLSPNGKTDRLALSRLSARPAVGPSFAAVWRAVLGVAEAAPDDDFFDRGGDSLAAMDLVARARESGLRLRTRDVYTARTFAAIAAAAQAVEPSEPADPDPGRPDAPLSPAQQRFLEWDYADRDHYNVSLLFESDRPLDRARLAAALAHVSGRHPALRLRLPGQALRKHSTAAAPEVPLSWHELGDLGEEEQRETQAGIAESLQRSLSLSDGPVWAAARFGYGGRHPEQVLVVLHHMVADGVSLKVIAREVAAYYAAPSDGFLETTAAPPPWQAHTASLQAVVNGPLSDMFRRFWTDRPWAHTGGLPAARPDGSMHVAHVSSFETTVEFGEAVDTVVTEELLIAALGTAVAAACGTPAAAVAVCRHGREDLAGAEGFAGTVGWLNSIAPYVVDVAGTASTESTHDRLLGQIRRTRQLESTWGALLYLHTDPAVRRQTAALGSPEVYLNYLGSRMRDLSTTPPLRVMSGEIGTEMTPDRTQPYRIKVHAETVDYRLSLKWSFSADVDTEESVREIAAACADELTRLHAATRLAGPAPSNLTPEN
ncbi:amino acid adenylation domain-containing protein [Streptacidiphilus sp. BW17]|uniref:amino acid adenylation domain-containing protein n=1 Tax=Streptacidiphilus sp. BW17 TaxID=3156274 RepID=UPI003514CBC9